ncbi:MAG TPA: DUF4097 family beta strand repeat-containing protein [Vicinamibacterales bacterium]|jgi:hypothetical protein|nr:DUF4097 family beta strand repeat-containing protein [Vicinamibacterales bacterium]
MTSRSFPAVAVAAVLAVAGAACDVHVGENGLSVDVASGKATEDWSRTYPVARGATVEIVNTNGTIEVEPGGDGQLEVKATKTARAGSDEEARALLKTVEIKEEAVSSDQVRLKTTTSSGPTLGRRSAIVEYHIKAPAGLKLTVRTENGGVNLRDVSGVLTAATTNGGVRGSNLSGSVSAHAVNGGLVIDMAQVAGAIDMDVVNGGIRLDIPSDAKADIDAHTVNGGVVVDRALSLSGGEQGRSRITGALNGGGARINASTVNGGVRINARGGSRSATNAREETAVIIKRKN